MLVCIIHFSMLMFNVFSQCMHAYPFYMASVLMIVMIPFFHGYSIIISGVGRCLNLGGTSAQCYRICIHLLHYISV